MSHGITEKNYWLSGHNGVWAYRNGEEVMPHTPVFKSREDALEWAKTLTPAIREVKFTPNEPTTRQER